MKDSKSFDCFPSVQPPLMDLLTVAVVIDDGVTGETNLPENIKTNKYVFLDQIEEGFKRILRTIKGTV